MLSLRHSSQSSQKITPHLLPCKIHHDGNTNASEKYWTVTTDSDTTKTKTAYFRGRRLVGKDMPLPDGYTGAVLNTTGEIVAPSAEEIDDGEKVETKVCAEVAVFDAITVWGHEVAPESSSGDAMLRGIEEWVRWAGKINSWEEEEA
ncbi:ribonuclease H2, subunit C [Sphaerosporella brunnea]|uniref:Ribonuclease H2, subunit C n=1 Tax=Sphaerosporella brunnea TaxID=1250544 RepID=A0A5J5EMF9_9PEZI|nr:ribonuclease H2, subunit C [Sphaerosporella brunnea]